MLTSLLQGRNAKRRLTVDHQLPIGHKLIAMQFYPSLHQLQLSWRQFACQNSFILNGNGCLEVLVANVKMWQVMVIVILEQQCNQNSVKHANGRHDVNLVVRREQFNHRSLFVPA